MSDNEIYTTAEATAIVALEMLRRDIAAIMPATPELALVARLNGRPDALDLFAALSNRIGDRFIALEKAHPRAVADQCPRLLTR